MATSVRRGRRADVDAAAAALGDAFADYPWTRWTVQADGHVERIVALQRLAIERLAIPFGDWWVAEADGHVVGTALWVDGERPPPPGTWAALTPEVARLEGDRHEAALAAEALVEPHRPAWSALHLGTVGVAADHRRRGVGAALLAPVLAEADERGVEATVETSTARNVAFYERLGFDATAHVSIPDGPDVWLLRRRPR